VARANAGKLMADERLRFLQGDLFDALPAAGDGAGPFDMIVSNPPYIPTAEIEGLMPEVSRYEPRLALDGGSDGLDFYRRLAAGCAARLRPDGALFLEIGAGQGGAVSNLFRAAGSYGSIEVAKDLAGLERVFSAVRAGA
jgi:release factor glutamine methyltransferase